MLDVAKDALLLFLILYAYSIIKTVYASLLRANSDIKESEKENAYKQKMFAAFDEGVKYGVVKDRVQRVNAIGEEQHSIYSSATMPSANAVHSRYKNSIVDRFKELEKEKLEILKSIVKDGGHDVMLTIVVDGDSKLLKVAQVVDILEGNDTLSPDNTPDIKTDANNNKKVRFKLVKKEGDKDDNSKEHSNPEVH